MPLILPFPIIVTTTISITFCLVILALTFLNLDLVWPNLIAAGSTAAYHFLVILLAWYRMYRNRTTAKPQLNNSLPNTHGPLLPSMSMDPEDHAFVPYPTLIITLGLIIFAVWVIIFGMAIDIVVKGMDSTLVSERPSHFDHTGLVANVLVIAVETTTIVLFVVCCVKGQKKSNDVERDELEDKWFYPATPVLGRSGTLKSLARMYSKRSTRVTRTKTVTTTTESPLPPPPILLEPHGRSITRQHISPWEMLTPKAPSIQASSPVTSLSHVSEIGREMNPQLTPLRRPPSTLPPTPLSRRTELDH